ncbi:hypothetical protein PHLCEN_2v8039 [Hermanssonia centrifuga]|uniref:Uncharacterized protein n=1 Tax=Hermanssonia centrifuga TaxID=98765 RepID=A0A2R6NVD8_9APHY|nr:hypothetical protein PHLCEN_2v8039 [Hermanssonia centrifuga]
MLGLLAPEILLIAAHNQRCVAVELMNKVNEHFGITPRTPWYRRVPSQVWSRLRAHLWRSAKLKASDSASSLQELQLPLDSEKSTSTPTSTRVRWTIVHGFYAAMGGFVFDASAKPSFLPNAYTRAILTPDGLSILLEHEPDLIPDLSEAEIMDKSKADGLAKSLALLQALWFCINCISRLAQRLPLSLLEVTTVAHAFCTFFTYLLWWHKPLNIREPTLISGDRAREACAYMWMASPLKRYRFGGLSHTATGSELAMVWGPHVDQITASLISPSQTIGDVLPRNIEDMSLRIWGSLSPSIFDVQEVLRSTSGAWYSRKWDFETNCEDLSLTSEDIERWTLASKAFIRYGPPPRGRKRTFGSLVTAEAQLHGEWGIDSDAGLLFIAALLTATYGVPHVAAWNTPFATHLEQTLWRCAALVVTTAGTLCSLLSLIDYVPWVGSWLPILGILSLPVAYTVSSAYLLVESFKQLAHLPPAAYQLPSWSNYFPHFS